MNDLAEQYSKMVKCATELAEFLTAGLRDVFHAGECQRIAYSLSGNSTVFKYM